MLSTLVAALAGHVALTSGHAIDKRATTPAAYASNSDGSYSLTSITAPVQGAGSPGSAQKWELNIDDTSSGHKQTITGFGASVTDATVTSLNRLSSSTLSKLLNDLMTATGAEFSLMRHTIGASDLSGDPAYTYDDNGGKADTSLTGFGLGDRGTAMASLLAKMKSLQSNLKVVGSPWSAPGWMKLNNVIDGNADNNTLNASYSNAFAQYFVKYIQAYKSLGATVDAITVQNEPLYSTPGYPTMYMADHDQGDLIQNYIGPALAKAGLSTSIWAFDHNTDVPSYPQTVLSAAGKYVNTVAWHCYAPSLDWSVLTNFKKSNPGVNQYMTECATTPYGPWYQASNFTIGPLQNWASGVTAWTLGADQNNGPHLSTGGCSTCQGLVTVNNDGTYTLQRAYYMMAQYSKFMPRGAIILAGTGSTAGSGGIQSVASLNPDGTRTVVVQNTFSNDVYVTLSTKSGQKWSGNIPKNSVVTWVLPAASS